MRALLYIVTLLVIAGCSYQAPSVSRELDKAATLIHTDPAAAMERLNGYDISQFQDSATMARWALLYSEAMVANRIAAPTDTIVSIAIEYYRRHGNTDEFQRASRLKALIRAGNDNDALATALYLQKEKELLLYKERVRHQWHMSVAVLLMVAAAVIVTWMRQRMKLQSARSDALMAEAAGMRCQIETSLDDVGRMRSKLHGLLENRFAVIDSLCQTYYESQGTKTERKAVVEKVRNLIESVSSDSFSDIELAVDDCRDNLLLRVKESYPAITAEDYRLLVYLAGGFSTRTICLLLGESAEVVYKRKSRLKSRMRSHVAPTYPDIMTVF